MTVLAFPRRRCKWPPLIALYCFCKHPHGSLVVYPLLFEIDSHLSLSPLARQKADFSPPPTHPPSGASLNQNSLVLGGNESHRVKEDVIHRQTYWSIYVQSDSHDNLWFIRKIFLWSFVSTPTTFLLSFLPHTLTRFGTNYLDNHQHTPHQ